MNGFKLMADSYIALVKRGELTEDEAKRDIEIYEFLATCNTDDFCRMVDSSAFNDIITAFLTKAVKNAGIDGQSQDKVINQLRWIFDGQTAKEVLQDSRTDNIKIELPDPSVDVQDMQEYGYTWDGMLPLKEEAAICLYEKGDMQIFLLYQDGSESISDSMADIKAHAQKGGIFGIHKEDWSAYAADRKISNKQVSIFNIRMYDEERWFKNTSGTV